jgi:hypothetical protein
MEPLSSPLSSSCQAPTTALRPSSEMTTSIPYQSANAPSEAIILVSFCEKILSKNNNKIKKVRIEIEKHFMIKI